MQTNNGEWWNYSWNIAPGCTNVSEECRNCWARVLAKRLQGMKKPGYEGLVNSHGEWTGRVNLLEGRLKEPLKLRRPRVIAVNLMGDLFHPEVPGDFIGRVFAMMYMANWHTFMVLTKRSDRMVECAKAIQAMAGVRPNVWLGTTAGTQQSANERWSSMMLINQMGWNTWVSSEPRLENIDWHGWSFLKRMVTGGESGPYARPMSPAWPRADRDWCQAHEVKFHFKQWGEWGPEAPDFNMSNYPMTTIGGEMMFRFGRNLAGRVLDGMVFNGLSNGQTDGSG